MFHQLQQLHHITVSIARYCIYCFSAFSNIKLLYCFILQNLDFSVLVCFRIQFPLLLVWCRSYIYTVINCWNASLSLPTFYFLSSLMRVALWPSHSFVYYANLPTISQRVSFTFVIWLFYSMISLFFLYWFLHWYVWL